MKVRCTILCVVIAGVTLACRHVEAQQMVGPFQPGYQVAGSQRWAQAGYFPTAAAPGPYAQQAGPYLQPPGPGPNGQYVNYQQFSDMQPASYGGGGEMQMPGPATSCSAGAGGCGICGGCDPCRGRRGWAEAELLIWWREGRSVPALVTTSPQGTPRDLAGELGQPTTQILYGGERLTGGADLGGRFELGMWLDDGENCGIGVSMFATGKDTGGYSSGFSTGNPILARPFFNGLSNQQDALLIAFDQPPPPLPQGNDWVDGQVTVASGNQVYGGDLFLRKKINCGLLGEYCMFFLEGPAWASSMLLPSFRGFPSTDILDHAFSSHGQKRFSRVDLIGGYQYSKIDDSLSIRSLHVDRIPGNLVPNGTRTQISDLYNVNNEFHGGMLGLMAVAERGCMSLELLGKVGIGNMHQSIGVGGLTVVTHPPPFGFLDDRRPGGLYTAGSVGTYSRDAFTVVPEARAKLRYQVNCHLDLNISYSFMYWNNVALAGGLVNQTVNPQQTAPVVIQNAAFSVQGLACGLRYRF